MGVPAALAAAPVPSDGVPEGYVATPGGGLARDPAAPPRDRCAPGYEGNLCGACAEGYGHDSGGACVPCGPPSAVAGQVAAAGAGVALLIVAMIRATLRGGGDGHRGNLPSVMLKTLLSHLQVCWAGVACTGFDLL